MIQISNDLANLREAAEKVSHLTVNCKMCILCCENGLVYVLPEEEAGLRPLGVPIIAVDGIYYIQRTESGACPMMNKERLCCRIYSERPICCRLYPIDLFNRNDELEWGLYEYCPTGQKREAILASNNLGRIEQGLVLHAIRMIEKAFGPERIKYLAEEDKVTSRIEVLDRHRNDYSIIGKVLTHASD